MVTMMNAAATGIPARAIKKVNMVTKKNERILFRGASVGLVLGCLALLDSPSGSVSSVNLLNVV
jgi:hypothetical protein